MGPISDGFKIRFIPFLIGPVTDIDTAKSGLTVGVSMTLSMSLTPKRFALAVFFTQVRNLSAILMTL